MDHAVICKDVDVAIKVWATFEDSEISKISLQELRRLAHVAFVMRRHPSTKNALRSLLSFPSQKLSHVVTQSFSQKLDAEAEHSGFHRLQELWEFLMLRAFDELTFSSDVC